MNKILITLVSVCFIASFFLVPIRQAVSHEPSVGVERVAALKGNVTPVSVADIILALKLASSRDTVRLTLSSKGGGVASGWRVTHAIQNTKAKKVIAYIPRYCASVCATMTLYVDELQMKDRAVIMFHWYSFNYKMALPGTFLATVEPETHKYYIATFKKMLEVGLITKAELAKIYKGKDVRIRGRDYIQRWEQYKRSK